MLADDSLEPNGSSSVRFLAQQGRVEDRDAMFRFREVSFPDPNPRARSGSGNETRFRDKTRWAGLVSYACAVALFLISSEYAAVHSQTHVVHTCTETEDVHTHTTSHWVTNSVNTVR